MNKAITKFKQYLQCKYPESSTPKHYMSDLSVFSRFAGDVSPKEITPKLIDQFVQDQSQQGKKTTTINRRLSSLSSFFDFLIEDTEDDTWSNPIRWKRHAVKLGHHLPRDAGDDTVLLGAIQDQRGDTRPTGDIESGRLDRHGRGYPDVKRVASPLELLDTDERGGVVAGRDDAVGSEDVGPHRLHVVLVVDSDVAVERLDEPDGGTHVPHSLLGKAPGDGRNGNAGDQHGDHPPSCELEFVVH